MARCAFCKTKETELHENGSPICLGCAGLAEDRGRRVQAALVKALSEATMRADSAFAEFSTVMSDIPSGLPHPDGVQRIHNAAANLATARHQMTNAHARLTNYLERGIVPEDLKLSG